jgi:hypothetical protein
MTEDTYNRQHVVKIVLFAVFWIAGAVGCGDGGGGGAADDAWSYTDREVVGSSDKETSDSIQVDVYVDATTSMIGYLGEGSSRYTRFLSELESSIASGWAQSNPDYFKFGSRVRPIDRSTFRNADEEAFYRERGIYRTTRIDSVLERINRSRISVITTDLFQNESDVNALVSKIKTEVFRRGLDAAVLGIRSQFDGRVYDAKVPAYNYASTQGKESTYRPFYALMFGETTKLRRLFQTLQSSPFIQRDHFVLISPYIVQNYEVNLRKTRKSRDLNVSGTREDVNRFAFNLRSGGTGGTLRADINLERAHAAPRFSADRVEMVAYRKKLSRRPQRDSTNRMDSTRTQDLTLQRLRRSSDTLHATIQMNLKDQPSGMYSYKTVFRTGAIDGLEVPPWIDDFSSTNSSPGNDPNKTLNLEKFVSDLIQASSSVRRPKLSKIYITVRKL